MKKKIGLLLLIISAAAGIIFGEPDFNKMLEEIDQLGNFPDSDFSCTYTIVAEKPDEGRNVTEAKMFRRDSEDQFVLLILQPEEQKGQGYLQIEDTVWFYDPESRKFEHSSLKENIQSSDARNADFNRGSLAEDYDIVASEEGMLGRYPVYILDLEAVNNEVPYAKMKLWIRQDITIVLKAEEYGYSGTRLRVSAYYNYIRVGEKYLPSQILFVDTLNEGEKTQITMTAPSAADLPDFVFSKAYLERVNR